VRAKHERGGTKTDAEGRDSSNWEGENMAGPSRGSEAPSIKKILRRGPLSFLYEDRKQQQTDEGKDLIEINERKSPMSVYFHLPLEQGRRGGEIGTGQVLKRRNRGNFSSAVDLSLVGKKRSRGCCCRCREIERFGRNLCR